MGKNRTILLDLEEVSPVPPGAETIDLAEAQMKEERVPVAKVRWDEHGDQAVVRP